MNESEQLVRRREEGLRNTKSVERISTKRSTVIHVVKNLMVVTDPEYMPHAYRAGPFT